MDEVLVLFDSIPVMSQVKKYCQNEKAGSLFKRMDFFFVPDKMCKYSFDIGRSAANEAANSCVPPLIPTEWKVLVSDMYQKEALQLSRLLKEKNYSRIIIATEPSEEGNGKYDMIALGLGFPKLPLQRIALSDLSEKGIAFAFEHLIDYNNERMDILSLRYRMRNTYSWLIGLNASLAVSGIPDESIMENILLPYALKVIYQNNKQVYLSRSDNRYKMCLLCQENLSLSLMDENGTIKIFDTEEEAYRLSVGLKNIGKIVSFESKEERISPADERVGGALYNLKTLLYDAELIGLDYQMVLESALRLYERGYITYPITDGKKVRMELLKRIIEDLSYLQGMEEMSDTLSFINGEKMQALLEEPSLICGPDEGAGFTEAIVPTGKTPQKDLDEIDRKIYILIVKKLLRWLLPQIRIRTTMVMADNNSYKFVASGLKIIDKGYAPLSVSPIPEAPLKCFVPGSQIRVSRIDVSKIQNSNTKYITASELYGKLSCDVDKTNDFLLSVPAKRMDAINAVTAKKYAVYKGAELHITKRGMDYADALSQLGIGGFEDTMRRERILSALKDRDNEAGLYALIIGDVKEIAEKAAPLKMPQYISENNLEEDDPLCPLCGKPLRFLRYGLGCSGYPECRYIIYRKQHGAALSDNQLRMLAVNKTLLIDVYSKKTGVYYPAQLNISAEGAVEFSFL